MWQLVVNLSILCRAAAELQPWIAWNIVMRLTSFSNRFLKRRSAQQSLLSAYLEKKVYAPNSFFQKNRAVIWWKNKPHLKVFLLFPLAVSWDIFLSVSPPNPKEPRGNLMRKPNLIWKSFYCFCWLFHDMFFWASFHQIQKNRAVIWWEKQTSFERVFTVFVGSFTTFFKSVFFQF